jgi:hypothetical protein
MKPILGGSADGPRSASVGEGVDPMFWSRPEIPDETSVNSYFIWRKRDRD